MKQNIKEGIVDRIVNKGYSEYKKDSTMADVFKENGFKCIDVEKYRGYQIYYLTRDTNIIRYMQDPDGMPINKLVNDINVFLETNYSNLEASEVQGGKKLGIAIMIKNRNYNGPTPPPIENLDSTEEVDQIAEMVSRVVKKTLNEVAVNELPENEQNQWIYEEIMDVCKHIMLDNQYLGRRFNNKMMKRLADQDPEYAQHVEDILGCIQALFEQAKVMMRFAHDRSENDYAKGKAASHFEDEWTPDW